MQKKYSKYNHQKIEKKWQKYWEKNNLYKAEDFSKKKKKYILDMFPYPSGTGLHVGHVEGYTATDIYARFLKIRGFNVLHPMGWDAFGLPTENYAIKQNRHPKEITQENTDHFRQQCKNMGFSYDWSREINASNPDYYQWTQWLFLQLYKRGLAYRKMAPVNWCESCKTVLAREQVVNGKCERCKNQVIQKMMKQWFFKITDYAERLLKDLDRVDWPENIKEMQRNWIGKSEGAILEFKISNSDISLSVFTTRPDTIFGATYLVIAPEHSIIEKLKIKIENWQEVENYIKLSKEKNELQRTDLTKEKTGVEIKGMQAINPATGKAVPIWVADYVLISYGTGAIMAVPAHDERDFEFARKYKLLIRPVVRPVNSYKSYFMEGSFKKGLQKKLKGFVFKENQSGGLYLEFQDEQLERYIKIIKEFLKKDYWCEIVGSKMIFVYGSDKLIEIKDENDKLKALELCKKYYSKMAVHYDLFDMLWNCEFYHDLLCFLEQGVMVNSGDFNGLDSETAKQAITEKFGKPTVQYKLRDWLISRQRYWGAPIPIIYCAKCGEIALTEKDLPIELPADVDFKPTGDSPLKASKKFNKVRCPKCGKKAQRESDTMDTFVCSSWYYLRFLDPQNKKEFCNQKKIQYWMPIDLYIGGAEHAVMHLLYARFIYKVLCDASFIALEKNLIDEPFQKLRNQGLILAEDGRKMSKSLGNVVNPDEVVKNFGADTIRLFEMFIGPLEDAKPWDMKAISGVRRFLEKVWRLYNESYPINKEGAYLVVNHDLDILFQKTVEKVTSDIENFKFNTAIAQMMIFVNKYLDTVVNKEWASAKYLDDFILLLAPFAPYIAEEIYHQLIPHHKDSPSVFLESWPDISKQENFSSLELMQIIVQVDGKKRDVLEVYKETEEAVVKKMALSSQRVQKWIQNKPIKRIIFVKDRLINLVV